MKNTILVKYSIDYGRTWDEWMMDETLTEAEMVDAIINEYGVDREKVEIKIA